MQTVKVLGNYINGKFLRPRGPERKIVSNDPGDAGYRIGSFPVYPRHIDDAVASAGRAFDDWRRLRHNERADALRKFAAEVVNHRKELKELIAAETGKPVWEAENEVLEVEAQVETEIREGIRSISPFKVGEIRFGIQGSCRFQPLGVMVVLGSAISPVHLACSQILPALLSGCSVVFKPSKLVPATGQFIAHLFDEADIPRGVFNLVQGDAATGWALAAHQDVAGVLFTGSYPAGKRILQATTEQPHKLVALQMGGVNLGVVLDDADLERAVCENVKGAYLTTGQQYTSTGVILVQKSIFEEFTEKFIKTTQALKIGYAFERDVFMGPMLSASARERLLDLQDRLVRFGAQVLLKAEPIKRQHPGYYLSPAVFMLKEPAAIDSFRSEGLSFGPDVVLVPFPEDKQGYNLAASTRFPFSAAVFTEDHRRFESWAGELRFGLLNHNLATTDMSMRLPLCGLDNCGNHRPSGVFAQRNCTFPVASLKATMPFDPSRLPKNFPGK
ncbi:MAG: aldehyde dehydrogenase family protein [Deltaproteobacteria bacterium]|nr:aldehyde dehydrogenase family protein [Deltaproteobacteria bacterium]